MANHELYVVQGKTLDNIAGTMRAVLGVDKDAPIRFDEVANSDKTEQINADVETQADIIAQIQTALEGKAAGNGSEIIAEIASLIDQSKVLESTDGTVEDKVGQLIDKAEDESKWYEAFETLNQSVLNLFVSCTFETLPRMNPKKVPRVSYWFSGNKYLKYVDFYLNTESCTDFGRMFLGASSLEYVVGINTSKATTVQAMFTRCSSLHTIGEFVDGKLTNPLDFSSVSINTQCFDGCTALVNVSFVEESIKKSITIPSPVLSIGNVFDLNDTENVGSVQSIINGLATLAEGATAQTLTLSKNLPLTEEQKQAITTAVNNKGWTLAFA